MKWDTFLYEKNKLMQMKIIIDKIVKNCYHNIVEIKKTYNLKLNINKHNNFSVLG